MLVKCKCCGEQIDRDMAYKVSKGKTNEYYCTQSEYIRMITEKAQVKQMKYDILDMINEIFGREITNTALRGELTEIKKSHSLIKMYNYLLENKSDISRIILAKHFESDYGAIRYFAAILKNNLGNYELPEEPAVPKEIEFYEIKQKTRKKRKCLSDYM